jgi:glutamyl-tRNA synthetase
MGYCPEAVCEYVMTLLNSNYEEWRMQNLDKSYRDFPFNIKKMSVSGCLFDFNKLGDVSKNVICRMSAKEVADRVTAWAMQYDPDFGRALAKDPAFTEAIFATAGKTTKVKRCTSAEWKQMHPESADRPAFSALENAKLKATIGNEMRPWLEALESYLASSAC